ncbi:MAG: filamentous hemagglutinin N-terminal domain-containing protein [Planctomycetota bacterium]|nr:filamentous hemagglutinin N-terminal domain-containing protein [Planctomycetota bacterium]
MSDRARETTEILFVGLPLVGLICTLAWAGPDDPQVVRGAASFQRSGDFTTITVTDNAIINYRRFNIGASETVRFVQPGVDARVLNRITGAMPTRIDGTLLANGRVFLVNPSGVIFGKNSTVNVGTLIAGAGHMSNRDFLNGVTRFTNMQGEVRNEGMIRANEVVLAGNSVVNLGSILAPEGMVAMVAGDEVYLGREGSKMYAHITSTPRVTPVTSGVRNEGEINAEGGRAILAAGDMFSLALGTGSSITAKSVQIQGGAASLASVSGTIDASSTTPGTRGGEIEITGARVGLYDAQIDASGPTGGGEVLVGGDFQGSGETPIADATFVDSQTVIRADALQAGDGGKVIVFAEDATRVYGTLSARGGPERGDGGLIETSGKGFLDVPGVPDASAPNGQGGYWVLDPFNVSIINAAAGGGSEDGGLPNFTASVDDSVLSNGQINQALDAGTSVLISTNDGGSGTQAGNITQNNDAAITKSAGGNATIEFRSFDGNGDGTGGLITLSGGIVNTSGNDLNVIINADDQATFGGGLDSSVIIDTNAFMLGSGDLTVNAAALQLEVDLTGGVILFNTPLTVTGGNRTVTTTGASTFAAIAADGAARTLAINSTGTTTLGGAINDGNLSLTTNAAGSTAITGGITNAATLTFNDAVTLSSNVSSASVTFGDTVTVTGGNRTVTTTGASTFAAIAADGAARTLAINSTGTTTLGGAINDTDLSLTTNAVGATILSADVTAASATFGDTVTVTGANRTVTTTGASTFAAIAADGAARTLAINSTGTTTLGGTINDTDLSLTTNAAGSTAITGGITNAATLTFNDAVTLSSNVSSAAATFGDTVTVTGANRTVTTTGASTFAAIAADGVARTLAINSTGTTTLGGTINDTDLSLTTNAAGSTVISRDISGGAFTFNDPVTIAGTGERVLQATDAGGVVFGSTVALNSTVTGLRLRAEEIDFGNTVTPAGGAGHTLALEPGTVDIVFNGTAGPNQLDLSQTELDQIQSDFAGGVTIGRSDSTSDVRVASGGVTFTNFDATVLAGAGQDVILNGDINTNGNDLTVTLGTGGRFRLGGDINTAGGDLNLTGASDVDLIANSVLDTDATGGATDAGDITFAQAGTIDGAFNLSLMADADNGGAGGAVVIAQVGTVAALNDLTARGADITLPGIGAGTASGVGGSTDIESTGPLTFSGTLYLTNDAKYSASSFAVSGVPGQATRFGSSGDAVSFESAGGGDGAVTLAEDVDLAVDTGTGGNVTFEGPIEGTAGGVGESVTVTAGTGTVQFQSAVGGTVPIGSLSSTAATTQLGGSIQTADGGDITVTGDLQIREGQSVALTTGTGGDIAVTGAVFGTDAGGAEALTLSPGGVSTLGGGAFGTSAGAASSTGLTTLTTNSTTNLNGTILLTGGAFTSNGLLVVGSTAARIGTGTGTLTLADAAQFAAAMILEGTEIDLAGGAGSVSGSGTLTLIPATNAAAINVGTAAGAGAASLDLSATDLAALADGFASLTIGRAAGTHAVAIGDATFRDPLTLRSPGGTIALSGRLMGTGNAAFTFAETGSEVAFLSGGDVGITTQGGGISLADAVAFAGGSAFTLLSGGGDIAVGGAVSLGSGSTATVTSGGGDVSLASDSSGIDGAGVLLIDANTGGSVTLGAPVGATTPLTRLTVAGGVLTLPGAITTTGNQTYTGTTSAGGGYASTAGSIAFNNQLNLVGDLTLEAVSGVSLAAAVDDASGQTTPSDRANLTIDGQTTSAVTFGSTVGATTPIGTLTVRNATSVTASGAIAAENVLTTGIAGNAAFGAITTDGTSGLDQGFAIDLDAGSFTLPGPFVTAAGTGMRLALGASTGTATLGSGATTWDGLGGDLVQTGANGTVKLGSDVIGSNGKPLAGDVTFNSKLELDSDSRTISAQSVNILGGFLAAAGQGGVADLTLRSAGGTNTTTLRGLGGSLTGTGFDTLIKTLTIEGTSTLTGPIGTVNGMEFMDVVTIGTDAPTTLQVAGKGSIVFGSRILGSGAGSSLALQLDPTQTADTGDGALNDDGAAGLVSDKDFPVIRFGGNVGSATRRLGSLTLNGTPHTAIPALPTIVAETGSLSFFLTGDFTMGVGEKLAMWDGLSPETLGALTIDTTGGVVSLSDLAIAGDLNIVGASAIVLQNRDPGTLIGYRTAPFERFVSSPPPVGEEGDGDRGGDFVVLGTISVDGDPAVSVTGGGGFNIATPNGSGVDSSFNEEGVVIRQFGDEPGTLVSDDYGVVLGDGLELLLDLRADGPVVQNLSSALAGAIPRDPESGQVTQETRLSASQLEKLLKLGIRAVERDGIRISEGGPRVYNDAGMVTEMHQVSVNRMSSNAVDRVLDRFDSLFYRGEGAERVFDQDLPKRKIEKAVLSYFEANEDASFDASVIWDYLVAGTPEQVEAARSLFEVRMLIEDIGQIGLTDAEAALPRSRILGNLNSQEVFESVEEVAALVEVSQPIAVGTPASIPSEAQPEPEPMETSQQP